MALLSTYEKFKKEHEQHAEATSKQGSQAAPASVASDGGLMTTYQKFMAKKEAPQAGAFAEDYGQRVLDVLQKVDGGTAAGKGGWTVDASGGHSMEINALLREYDAYSGDKSDMTQYRNLLMGYNTQLQRRNEYFSRWGSSDEYDRERSGYTNYGVGYTPQSWGLDEASARSLRKNQAQKDAKTAQRARAAYESAQKAYLAARQQYKLLNGGDGGAITDEELRQIYDDYVAAQGRMENARDNYLNIQNRLDSYNATWGKIDRYAGDTEAARGTDTTYHGVGYDELTDWENKRQEERLGEEARAMRTDYVPGTLTYTADKEPKVEDELGLWRSMSQEQRQYAASSSNGQLARLAIQGGGSYWDLLTDDEVSTYYYIRNQRGQEAANRYLDDMYIELSRRNDAGIVRDIENADTLEKAGMTALSVGANLIGAIPAAMGKTADWLAGRKNPYSSSQIFQRYASYVRGSVGQDLEEKTTEALADKLGQNFAEKAGAVANQTFQALMSGVDSAAGVLLFGQGAAIPAGPFDFHVGGYTTVMGLGAFAQRAQELEQQGATRAQIALGSIGSGILEALFEDVSMEAFFTNILEAPAETAGEFVKKLVTQMGVEASEEVCTEIGNMVWDAIVLGKNADNSRAIREYMQQGMSRQEAKAQAAKDAAADIFWAGYGGAVSAGAMAGVGQAVRGTAQAIDASRSNYQVGAYLLENGDAEGLVAQAESLSDDKARKQLTALARQAAERQASGDDSFGSRYQTGKTANRIAGQAQKEGKNAQGESFRAVAEDYLKGQDVGNPARAQRVLSKAYLGEYLNPVEKAYYASIGGEKLLSAIVDSVPEGSIETDTQARQARSQRTVLGTYGAVVGKKSVADFSRSFATENNGQTFRLDTKEPVNIQGISRVTDDGKLLLKTDGGEVEASQVSYGNYGEARLFRVLSAMDVDTDTANRLLDMVNTTSMSTETYASALQSAYLKGYTGVEFDKIGPSTYASRLTEEQRRVAWEAGHLARETQVGKQAETVDTGSAKTARGGLKIDGNVDMTHLNEAQSSTVGLLRALAECGVPIELYASTQEQRAKGAPNGSFAPDSTIRIDLNAGDRGQGAMAYAIAHEITHFSESYSPQKFQALVNILVREAGEQGISWEKMLDAKAAELSRMEQNKGLEENRLYDLARSECIAEMCETMLSDTDAAARVSQQLQKQDKGLWKKIKGFFKGLVERLKKAYAEMTPDSAIARETKRLITQSEAIRNAWVDAVSDSVMNYQLQDGQKKNAREGVTEDGVKYSARELSKQIDEVANQTFDTKNQVYYGTTPKALSKILSLPIMPMLGTYTHAYTMALGKEQALNEGRKVRGLNFHDLGWNMVKKIPELLNHPLAIIKSNTNSEDGRFVVVTNAEDKSNNPIIVAIEPKGSGKYYGLDLMDTALLSSYGKDNFEAYLERAKVEKRILWVDKNNHQKQASPGVQFSNALLSSDYTDNLAQFKQIVKREFKGTIFQNTFDEEGNRLFSSRTQQDKQLDRLVAQNEKLRQETEYLRQLVQIQKSGNKSYVLDRNSVKQQAKNLMDFVNAKGISEFSGLLNDFYRQLTTEDMDIDAMTNRAGELADWLLEHHTPERDGYAQEVLDFLAKRRVSLSDGQIGDIEYSYGSLNDFRRAIKGSIILDQNSTTSLDQLWQEAAARFPDRFSSETVEADMPDGLAGIVDWARNAESDGEAEFQNTRAEQRNDLTQKILEGYWEAKPVESVSDKLKGQIAVLKEEHRAAMRDAKAQLRDSVSRERARSEAAIEAYKAQRDAIDKAQKGLYETQRRSIEQVYSRQMRELRQQSGEDTKTMQQEFFRLLREYDKQQSKGEKRENQDAQTIASLREQLQKEASSHKEDSTAWNREFNRLLREYEASGRKIDSLEAKVESQRQSAAAKVESRRQTELRGAIGRTASTLNRYLLQPSRTVHVPVEMQKSVAVALDTLNGAMADSKLAGNAERLSEYAYLLRELQKNPSGNAEKIADTQRKIQELTGRDGRFRSAMSALKEQYEALNHSGDPMANQIYDENVAGWLQECLDTVKDTEFRDMNSRQLESVQKAYRALLRRIQTANKAFREGKQAAISEQVSRFQSEMALKERKGKLGGRTANAVSQFFWNNLKPVYAFERMGSTVLSDLYENLRGGEDIWCRDVTDARAYFVGTAAKYNYNTWDFDTLTEYTAASGQKFKLNLEERMSLYAYSLRQQARDHLRLGGIVLNENTERTIRDRFGIQHNKVFNDANAYNLTDETIADISSGLTQEQRQFAREMQQYLSVTMGAKGNEVSRALYDIDLYKEQFYWPLISSRDYSARIKEAQENPSNKLKNMGASKPTTPGANNPVVLSGFMETWAGHVNQMSMYHAFTLPMEDFYRVYNWNAGFSEEQGQSRGTVQLLKDVYGDGAVNYIDQFLKDLNGGLRADPRATVVRAMLSQFKKAAVFASASVAIQQPSAIGRAFSVIDPKYFVGLKVENAGESWEQCKKYAPVAGIKEMGRFDMDMGRSTVDFITAKEYSGFREKAGAFLRDTGYRDEILGKAPEMADQITWCTMWEAAKRQTAAKTGLKGEALLTEAGKLFTQCITRTQVYDSVFSRSANMRSKDTGMAMATAFMAEPTTSINMIENAVRQWGRGDKAGAAKAVASVLTSVVLNSALVSFVYAARNRDEDKTYWEKYLASMTGELMEGVNPVTYVPYAQDVWSMLQGYDLERSDMSLAADAVKALNKIVKAASKYPKDGDEEDRQAWLKNLTEAMLTGADGVASILGIPEKNIRRDVEAVLNLFRASNWGDSDSGTVRDAIAQAVKDAIPIVNQLPGESREKQLYKAILGGSPAQLRRLQSGYKTAKALETATVAALRENDPRISQAAQAHVQGDDKTRLRISKEIIAEKHFTQNQVVVAIQNEISSMEAQAKNSDGKIREQSLYYVEDYIDAVKSGSASAEAIRQEIQRAKIANSDKGPEDARQSAEQSFVSSVRGSAKEQFLEGNLTMEQTEQVLKAAGAYDGDEEDIHQNVYAWQIAENLGGGYDWSTGQYVTYWDTVRPTGIEAGLYDHYLSIVSAIRGIDYDGDGKKDAYSAIDQVLAYIDNLPIRDEQKDLLFLLRYPTASARTLRRRPWIRR